MAHPIELVDWTRFWKAVDRRSDDECWPWLRRIDRYGYGVYRRKNKAPGPPLELEWRAHRLAYENLIGPIPDDLVIDHLCRNRSCVNPSHMEPVTNRTNLQRGHPGRKPHIGIDGYRVCRNGHAVTGANARPHHTRPNHMACVACAKLRAERWRAARR